MQQLDWLKEKIEHLRVIHNNFISNGSLNFYLLLYTALHFLTTVVLTRITPSELPLVIEENAWEEKSAP